MKFVYVLQSISRPEQRYSGSTDNLEGRLQAHNDGKSYHTAKYRPWEIVIAIQFEDDQKALAFECYLKSGSGHAFHGAALLARFLFGFIIYQARAICARAFAYPPRCHGSRARWALVPKRRKKTAKWRTIPR